MKISWLQWKLAGYNNTDGNYKVKNDQAKKNGPIGHKNIYSLKNKYLDFGLEHFS